MSRTDLGLADLLPADLLLPAAQLFTVPLAWFSSDQDLNLLFAPAQAQHPSRLMFFSSLRLMAFYPPADNKRVFFPQKISIRGRNFRGRVKKSLSVQLCFSLQAEGAKKE